jgi:hypothetical protein
MGEIVNPYRHWNNALWNHFFPQRRIGYPTQQPTENPILYLDAQIIQKIGENNDLTCQHINGRDNWEQDFLSNTLLSQWKIDAFPGDWERLIRPGDRCKAAQWDGIVDFLKVRKFNLNGENIPAYFGMLCAIMYLACTQGAVHSRIKREAEKDIYLGAGYRGRVGELVDDLMQQLHKDVPSFDADRMLCGTQRHMSRIKFHTVLRPKEREDFIDFLEINNLEWYWEYETYDSYVNNRLIPALDRAGKRAFVNLVSNSDFIPYVKNILKSGLNFGKENSDLNTVQVMELRWKYELYFDSEGHSSFYISAFDNNLSIELCNGRFCRTDQQIAPEYIANFNEFKFIQDQEVDSYLLKNIASESWNDEIVFEKVGYGAYYQINEKDQKEGHSYIKLINSGKRNWGKRVEGWSPSNKDIGIESKGFLVYEKENYTRENNVRNGRSRSTSNTPYSLYGIGSWFRVQLEENQKIYWEPRLLGAQKQEIQYIRGFDGQVYFQLKRTSERSLIGRIYTDTDKNGLSEDVSVEFAWDGVQRTYYQDGWGQVSAERPNIMGSEPTRKQHIIGAAEMTEHSDILVRILYDLADVNGCVTERKMVAALDFVLGFFNIVPTKRNRKNIIYALRRLGYITAFYNASTRSFENQLQPAYLEASNYKISARNAFLVKGIYDSESLATLVGQPTAFVRFKRPYAPETILCNPEYVCLPDMILIETNTTQGWKVQPYPIAEPLIHLMNSMSGFEEYFDLKGQRDLLDDTPRTFDTPCMIKDKYGNEILCTSERAQYYTHRTCAGPNNDVRLIPKHLSRLYCQIKHQRPVCILDSDDRQGVNYAKITFASGIMGRPEILDIALCDLNLGLPEEKLLFIVNDDNEDVRTVRVGYSYSTGTMDQDHGILMTALRKLSGQDEIELSSSSAVLLSRNMRRYHMKRSRTKDYKSLLCLHRDNELLAYSENNRVFYTISEEGYREVLNENATVNQKLSDVILHPRELNLSDSYQTDIPDFTNMESMEVKIVNRIIN